MDERVTTVGNMLAIDPADLDGLTYSQTGGGRDSDLFSVSSDGELSLVISTDFEHPADADLDNTYEIEIQAEFT